MAKKSAILRNNKVKSLVKKLEVKRAVLSKIIGDLEEPFESRLMAMKKLSELPRNGSKVRIRKRCEIDGRPRGFIGYFGMSRINFRHYANWGRIPGVKKSSW
ncbi:MAG: small subunit ribosomal protein S14 [Rickettsiales bacterium]|jgi:small subunit ribosomal protein S14